MKSDPQTLDEFFAGHKASRQIFEALYSAIVDIGPMELRVTKSQVAFRRQRTFAWAWIPAAYLHGKLAPLVLTVGLKRRDASARWKQVVEPYPGRFTHHLELWSMADIDNEVLVWLREAWEEA